MAALRIKIEGFAILTNNEYVELAATINKQLQLDISDVNLEVVDYQFASERNGRGTNSTNKPTAKRPKNEVLDNSKYAELSTAFNETYRSNISGKTIAFMDITLQNHRAVNMATQLMNNPVVGITGDHQNSGPPAAATSTTHAAANCTTVTPNAAPSIKKETTPTSSRRTLFNKQQSPIRTFEWQSKPTNERNHCIDTAAFINTLSTGFPTAQTTNHNQFRLHVHKQSSDNIGDTPKNPGCQRPTRVHGRDVRNGPHHQPQHHRLDFQKAQCGQAFSVPRLCHSRCKSKPRSRNSGPVHRII
jgi:hypothetical protein